MQFEYRKHKSNRMKMLNKFVIKLNNIKLIYTLELDKNYLKLRKVFLNLYLLRNNVITKLSTRK